MATDPLHYPCHIQTKRGVLPVSAAVLGGCQGRLQGGGRQHKCGPFLPPKTNKNFRRRWPSPLSVAPRPCPPPPAAGGGGHLWPGSHCVGGDVRRQPCSDMGECIGLGQRLQRHKRIRQRHRGRPHTFSTCSGKWKVVTCWTQGCTPAHRHGAHARPRTLPSDMTGTVPWCGRVVHRDGTPPRSLLLPQRAQGPPLCRARGLDPPPLMPM